MMLSFTVRDTDTDQHQYIIIEQEISEPPIIIYGKA